MENKITPELKERFEQILVDVSKDNCKTFAEYAIRLMYAAYQLDRSSLFSRADVERIAENVRTEVVAECLGRSDKRLNQIIEKR